MEDQQIVESGFAAVENFIEIEKLATIGFLGERLSGFDMTLGQWIYKSSEASASDLAKAVCYKYSLDWTRQEDETNFIR